MNKQHKNGIDPAAPYRSIKAGVINAPNKPKDAPRATKTVASDDLRPGK